MMRVVRRYIFPSHTLSHTNSLSLSHTHSPFFSLLNLKPHSVGSLSHFHENPHTLSPHMYSYSHLHKHAYTQSYTHNRSSSFTRTLPLSYKFIPTSSFLSLILSLSLSVSLSQARKGIVWSCLGLWISRDT